MVSGGSIKRIALPISTTRALVLFWVLLEVPGNQGPGDVRRRDAPQFSHREKGRIGGSYCLLELQVLVLRLNGQVCRESQGTNAFNHSATVYRSRKTGFEPVKTFVCRFDKRFSTARSGFVGQVIACRCLSGALPAELLASFYRRQAGLEPATSRFG